MIALAVPHCPWDPDRKKSLARLEQRLNLGAVGQSVGAFKVFGDLGPSPPHVWARKVFDWALEQTHCTSLLQIQDDVLLPEKFFEARAALRSAIDEPEPTIAYFTFLPWAKAMFDEGARIFSTGDVVAGPCWEVSLERIREHVRWMDGNLREGCVEALHEDELLGLSHAAHGWRIYGPLPALADHDDALASHYENDAANARRASLSWKGFVSETFITHPKFWKANRALVDARALGAITHFGCQGTKTSRSFCRWVKPFEGWELRADAIEREHVRVVFQSRKG